VTGTLAAAAGNGLIGGSFPLVTVFCEAVAGGAVLALVTHAMIPGGDRGGRLADRAADRGRLPLRPIPGARRILRLTGAACGDATLNAGSDAGR
jgi:hypothetical protein